MQHHTEELIGCCEGISPLVAR